jgi:putative SOS response-associated peptidase YedK
MRGRSHCRYDIFGFLICEPNTEIGRVHPKAMPVLLTTSEEHDVWLRGA